MRLIAAVRLSRLTDATTSVDSQTERIQEYAQRNGHTIVALTEDLDVSGGKPIRERPGVGKWLTPERLGEWDGIAGYVIDRMFRNHYDFVTFYYDFLKPHGKKLIVVGESIDMSTDEGEMMAHMRVLMAQSELRKMSERRSRAADRLSRAGRWGGGSIPYGYQPEKDGDGWKLVPCLEQAEVLRWIAQELIGGRSQRDIAVTLSNRRVATPRGGKYWRGVTVADMMRSPVLKGYIVSKGAIVRDSDGVAVRREAVLTDGVWSQVQKALGEGSKPKESGRRSNASLLLRVAFCGKCGEPLYLGQKRDRNYAYYTCASKHNLRRCGERSTRADLLESAIEDRLLEELNEVPMLVKRVTPGEDNAKQVAELEEGIANLEAQAVDDPLKADTYVRMIGKLEDRRDKLAALPVREESAEWVPVSPRKTFAHHWASLDKQGRHSFLRESKVRVIVRHLDPDEPVCFPMPDPRGTVIRMVGNGLQISIYLGDLAELRDRASRNVS